MQYKLWLGEWFENYIKPTSKSKTSECYSDIIKKRLIPKFGEYDLSDITPIVIQKYVAELLQTGNLRTGLGLASNSVNGIVTVMQNSLKTAYLLGKVPSYLGDRIKRPRKAEREASSFTLQEQKKIEAAVRDSDQSRAVGITLCLYTGLRLGELLALSWNDIDLNGRTLSVNKTCRDGKDKDGVFRRIVEDPKTESSKRVIPLPRQIIPLLRIAKKKSGGEYVVCSSSGEPISVRSYQSFFAKLLDSAAIPRKPFHSLRHTFATRALECSVDVKTLSEVLGHKNATITLNRYVHSLDEHKFDMMNRIGKLL